MGIFVAGLEMCWVFFLFLFFLLLVCLAVLGFFEGRNIAQYKKH